jgi:hypothetical protein
VIENVRSGVEHDAQRRFVALEVGNQDLEPAVGNSRACLFNRSRELRGSEIRQIVAVDRGDDDVIETERVDRTRDFDWFVRVRRGS